MVTRGGTTTKASQGADRGGGIARLRTGTGYSSVGLIKHRGRRCKGLPDEHTIGNEVRSI